MDYSKYFTKLDANSVRNMINNFIRQHCRECRRMSAGSYFYTECLPAPCSWGNYEFSLGVDKFREIATIIDKSYKDIEKISNEVISKYSKSIKDEVDLAKLKELDDLKKENKLKLDQVKKEYNDQLKDYALKAIDKVRIDYDSKIANLKKDYDAKIEKLKVDYNFKIGQLKDAEEIYDVQVQLHNEYVNKTNELIEIEKQLVAQCNAEIDQIKSDANESMGSLGVNSNKKVIGGVALGLSLVGLSLMKSRKLL